MSHQNSYCHQNNHYKNHQHHKNKNHHHHDMNFLWWWGVSCICISGREPARLQCHCYPHHHHHHHDRMDIIIMIMMIMNNEHDYDHDNEFSSTIFLRSTTFLRQRPFMFGSRPTAAIWEKKEDEVYCQNTTIHCIGVFDIVWYETGIWDLRSYPCVIQVIHIVCFIGSSQTTLPNHRNGFINPTKPPIFTH